MAEMFVSASAYDNMMGRWSTRLAPLFVGFARVRDGARILDVGCGTGSLVQAVADVARESKIVGIDPAPTFIEHCRKRFADPRFAFDCGNGMELPYPDGSFDQALSQLVLQFVPQPEKAAREMRRVTRPGGTVAAATWDAANLELSAVLWDEAVKLDSAAAARAPGTRPCSRKGQLAELWQATGFENSEETALEIPTEFSSFDDYWLPFTTGTGPHGVYVATLTPEQRDALRDALRRRLLGDRPDGPFSMRARALAVRGTVPKR